jgi:hypothetical protein
LLSVWLLYGGLELAEELTVIVKVQNCARDLDMEALLQLGSGLKPDVPALESPVIVQEARPAVDWCRSPLVPHGDWIDRHDLLVLCSLRLHQYFSVYRI